MQPRRITSELVRALAPLRFAAPVSHVYNPLDYAGAAHRQYIDRYGGDPRPRPVLLVGMNPGPWGMMQTGVPFGEVNLVRDWLGIDATVRKPKSEHPKRPIIGLDCQRSEVSGARLWGWARSHFGTPARFFKRFFVINYCPLVFLEAGGRNRTPDKLPAAERQPLLAACDAALVRQIRHYAPQWVIGVGAFAEARIRAAVGDTDLGPRIGRVLHPSPASPAANRGWQERATAELRALGIDC